MSRRNLDSWSAETQHLLHTYVCHYVYPTMNLEVTYMYVLKLGNKGNKGGIWPNAETGFRALININLANSLKFPKNQKFPKNTRFAGAVGISTIMKIGMYHRT